MKSSTIISLLFIGLIGFGFAVADEQAEATFGEEGAAPEKETNVGFPLPADDVQVFSVFPGGETKFTAGQEAEILIGLYNTGSRTYNVSGVFASLNEVDNYFNFLQNFTFSETSVLLAPKQEVSVSYKFLPYDTMDAGEKTLCTSVFYADRQNTFYADQPFNATVTIEDGGVVIDNKALVQYVGVIAVLAVALFFGAKAYSQSAKKARYNKKGASGDWNAGILKPGSKKSKRN